MKLRKVNPSKIKVPEVRVTARMNEEKTEQFKASVKDAGIDEPIKCFEVDGQLILSDGLHRLMEALANNLPLVDVYVREGTMEDVLCNNLMSGHLRGTHPVSEMVRSIKVLWKEYGCDSEKIAAKTGMTRDYVERLQLISELTPMCLKALDEERIGVGQAFALTKLKDPNKQEMVLGQLLLYRWNTKELEGYIRDVMALVQQQDTVTPSTKPREPVLIRCTYCGGMHEVFEIANPATCRECSGIMFAAVAEAKRSTAQEVPPKTEP